MGWIGRKLFALLKGTAVVYAMVVGILWFMQRDMLFHRSDGRPMLNDAGLEPKREIVCLTTADGLNLRSWYFRPDREARRSSCSCTAMPATSAITCPSPVS